MKTTITRLFLNIIAMLFILPVFSFAAEPITTIPEKGRHKWWAPRHEEKVAEAKTGKAQHVMIGDSITHYWNKQKNYKDTFAKYNTLNLGFGGDRTQNVLWRIQNGELDGVSPKVVTMMIGTNNIKRDTPADIALGIKAIVSELRQRLPESKIIVFSIFPRKHSRGKGEDFKAVEDVNKLLPAIADNKRVFHVDLNKNFLDQNGEINPKLYGRDMLHLSNDGYAAWTKALLPLLEGIDPTEVKQDTASKENTNADDNSSTSSDDSSIIRLWPIEMIGGEKNRLKEVYRDRRGNKQLSGILDPYMTVYKAKSDKPTPAIVYCPGGAYMILGIPSKEDIKKWNDKGISIFLLRYTIPNNPDAAFKDVQRAVRMVRHQAKKWNVDPNQIGVLGNSAGAHLSARLTQNYDQKVYDLIDEADKESCEPNFAILQCAAYFQGRKMDKEFDAEMFHMKNKVAPTFLTYSKDDKFCKGGVEYDKRLKAAGGSINLKLFEKGGHGMGGCDWITPAMEWLKEQKIIK